MFARVVMPKNMFEKAPLLPTTKNHIQDEIHYLKEAILRTQNPYIKSPDLPTNRASDLVSRLVRLRRKELSMMQSEEQGMAYLDSLKHLKEIMHEIDDAKTKLLTTNTHPRVIPTIADDLTRLMNNFYRDISYLINDELHSKKLANARTLSLISLAINAMVDWHQDPTNASKLEQLIAIKNQIPEHQKWLKIGTVISSCIVLGLIGVGIGLIAAANPVGVFLLTAGLMGMVAHIPVVSYLVLTAQRSLQAAISPAIDNMKPFLATCEESTNRVPVTNANGYGPRVF